MIDNGIIKSRDFWIFSHLTKDFFNANVDRFENYNNPYKYKLWNELAQDGKCFLTVEAFIDGYSGLLRISGSLRKWYFGANSTEDLTNRDFIKVLEMLSIFLDIPYTSLLDFYVTRVEIGRNIRLNVPVSPLLGTIAGFINDCYEIRLGKSSRLFTTDDFKVTLYDKFKEINKKKPKRELIKMINDSSLLNKNVNLLRVEFTIMNGKSLVEKRLGFNSLRDFVNHYEDLYSFFWKYSKKLQLIEDISINRVPKNNSWGDLKKIILEEAIRNQGYIKMTSLCSSLKGKVKRDAHAYLRRVFCINQVNSSERNKNLLLRAIRVELLIHIIKSGWAKESSRIVPPINYSI